MKKILFLLLSGAFLFFSTGCGNLFSGSGKSDKNEKLALLALLASGTSWTGTAQWAKSVTTGPSNSELSSVAVGSDGIYAAGYITGDGTYDLGNSKTVAGNCASSNNAVIVKYDTNGNAQWAKSVTTGPSNSGFYSVAVGSDGIYAAGVISGNGTYGFGNSKTVVGNYASGNNLVIVKYDTNGNAQWAKSVTTGPSYSEFDSVAVGSDGIYAAGLINGNSTYDLGNFQTVAGNYAGNYNTVLVKYDTNGNAQWAKSVTTGPSASGFFSVAVGSDGIYTAGYIAGNGTYNFGNFQTVAGNSSSYNTVLVKYDTNGNAQWAKSVTTGPSDSGFYSVAVRSDGIYAVGRINGNGTYDWGNSKTVAGTYASDYNVVIVKYDTSGNAQWAKSVSAGPSASGFYSVAVGSDGIYAVGGIRGNGTYDFGNAKTVAGANEINPNIVIVKYDTSGNAQWARSVTTGLNFSVFTSAAIGSDGIYAAGFIYGNGIYDFGNAKTVAGTYSGYNVVMVKYR